jgi:hypothetical protein
LFDECDFSKIDHFFDQSENLNFELDDGYGRDE